MATPIRAHFIGEFADDAAAVAFVVAQHWTPQSDPTNPWQGMFYRNTTTGGWRIWTGTAWDDLGAGFGGLLSGIKFVAKNGNDTTGDGSIVNPYLTIQKGITETGVNGAVLIAGGIYEETINITQSVHIQEMVRGTVTIRDAVVGGAVVTVTPAAAVLVHILCNVENTSDTGPGDIAIEVDNSAPGGDTQVKINGEHIDGGAAGTALQVLGDTGEAIGTRVWVDDVLFMQGGIVLDHYDTGVDFTRFNNVAYEGGAAAWMTVTGTGGNVIIGNSLLASAANGETLDFGGGAACGVTLDIGSSVIAGVLELNNNAGTGIVVLTAGTQIGTITATLADQILQKWLGEDEFKIVAYNIDANAVAATTMYTVPAGRRFNPHTARTMNRGAATGALTIYRYNGTGNGSVVAAVGAAAIAQGIANETVVLDSIAAAGTLVFDITTASGTPGDSVDAEVIGRLF